VKAIFFFASIVVVILADQWTKILVLARFAYGESLVLIPDWFSLTYVRNTGAAFGFLADAHPSFRVPFFLIVPLIAMVWSSWGCFTVISPKPRAIARCRSGWSQVVRSVI